MAGMRCATAVASAAMILLLGVLPAASGSGCGTSDLSEAEIRAVEDGLSAKLVELTGTSNRTLAHQKLTRPGDNARSTLNLPIKVPVYVHVLRRGASQSKGDIYTGTIQRQIAVLNEMFKDYGLVKFELKGIDRVTKEVWARKVRRNAGHIASFKRALRKGGRNALNVYYVSSFADYTLRGFATFPWDYEKFKTLDGIVLSRNTLANTGEMRILGHEVGHWLGLLHVFQGGCDAKASEGDFVSDTPKQLAGDGCKGFIPDTCPNSPGRDSPYNFMDYLYGRCLLNLTDGQLERAYLSYYIWRCKSCV